MRKVNLNEMMRDLAKKEGLSLNQPIGQVKEVIALLGLRWRAMDSDLAQAEFEAIRDRAGSNSLHNPNYTPPEPWDDDDWDDLDLPPPLGRD